MEVDDGVATDTKPTEEVKEAVTEIVVEEITDPTVTTSLPVVDIEPIVIENTEKVEEKMKIDEDILTEKVEESLKENTVAGEALPTEVTEIEEIEDKVPTDVGEVIDDLIPVIEEPETSESDITELQNVGEVLEKECDEILSKVNDITNLDNITVKPLLTPILETTENCDSNDIVEKILESELELELKEKQNTDKASENIGISKEEDTKKQDSVESKTNDIPKEEGKVDEQNTTEEKSNEQSKTDNERNVEDKNITNEVIEPVSENNVVSENEPQLNGKSNGDTVPLNGTGGTEKELKSRLENGDDTKNGSKEEKDKIVTEADVPEIKVKTVSTEEKVEQAAEQTAET